MSRFLLGDQLGNIKVLRYSPQKDGVDIKTVHHQETTPASSVECLAINSSTSDDQTTVAAAFSNGSLLLSALKEDDTFEVLTKWNEPRLGENKFIGLSLDDRYYGFVNFSLQVLFISSLWLQCRLQLHFQWNPAKGFMQHLHWE